MSMMRTSSTSAGTKLVAVLMMSGSMNASSLGMTRTSIRRSAATSALMAASTESRKPSGRSGRSKSMRAVRFHVAAGDQRTVVPEHDTTQDVQPGVGSHQGGATLIQD